MGDRAFSCDELAIPRRLWIYTNYDCNLSCTYCVAESHPRAERRGLGMPVFRRLVDEAASLGFEEFFLTGGEPFILGDMHERISLAAGLLPTTVLTNGMLLSGPRLEKLLPMRDLPLTLQISLDGHLPELHDAYRGAGAWAKAVERIRELKRLGFRVAIGSTETPVNSAFIGDLRTFVGSLGIADEDCFVRPLAKRGYSAEGIELGAGDIAPELTVNNDGVYWHPLTTAPDLLLTKSIFPLSNALTLLHDQYHHVVATGGRPRPFK